MPEQDSLNFLIDRLSPEAIRNLQEICYRGSRDKGFHEDTDALTAPFRDGEWDQSDVRNLTNYYANKMMLIVGEVVEAHEQLRSGREMNETYYPGKEPLGDLSHAAVVEGIYKPEGIPSELADVVIRVFDLAQAAQIDLAAMIIEKLKYNATRPHKHGGKKF